MAVALLDGQEARAALVAIVAFALVLCIGLYLSQNPKDREYRRVLKRVPGPPSGHLLVGSMLEWLSAPGMEKTREWIQRYGPVLRYKAIFGADRVIISDPAALTYIMNTATYIYPKPDVARIRIGRVLGMGLVYAEGDVHRRQRRVMNPSFTRAKVQSLMPHFRTAALELKGFWTSELKKAPNQPIDVMDGLSRITMDALARAAFGVEFNCLNAPDAPLMKAYRGFISAAVSAPTAGNIVLTEVTGRIPEWLNNIIYKLPLARYADIRRRNAIAQEYAVGVIRERKKAIAANPSQEGEAEDILTSFIRANSSENPKLQLSDKELVAQIRTMIFAGHDSTTHTMSYILYMLAKHPDAQEKVRQEVTALLDSDPTADDFDSSPWLNAAIRESMRILPAVPSFQRENQMPDVIPLSTPITTKDGQTLHELPVPAHTEFLLSIVDYNTCPELWGADAQEFKPERWFEGDVALKEGVKPISGSFGGMISFLTGPRICIGWRFALLEIQIVLSTVLSNFEVEEKEKNMKVGRLNAPIMSPIVDGQAQYLPLRLKPISA